MVLVDTSVWSLALRRRTSRLSRTQQRIVEGLRGLIEHDEAAMTGPVRQELLSGLREESEFHRLAEVLRHFPYIPVLDGDYDAAASCFNLCRRAGVSAGAIDMLLCAVALRAEVTLMTCDADFVRYADVLDLALFEAGRS